MNTVKPYIGCKIALISKAQNKYVGILYTIDKVNSTVVLAKVKCFGTEGRPTDRPTTPRDDIYEYITFRGSDIKDISLCEAPPSQYRLPPDPAILLSSGASLPDAHSILNLGAVQVPIYHQVPAQLLHNEDYAAAFGIGLPMKRPMVEKAVQTIGIERNRRFLHPSNDGWEPDEAPIRASVREPLVRQPVRPPPRLQAERDPTRHRPPPMTMRGGSRLPPNRQNQGYRQNIENIPPRRRLDLTCNSDWRCHLLFSMEMEDTFNAILEHSRQSYNISVETGRGYTLHQKSCSGSWRGRNRHNDGPLRFDADFDFDFSNAQFINDMQEPRNTVMEEAANDSPFEDPFGQKCVYNKAKSFYDNISSPELKLRSSWAEERQRNMETFGTSGWPLSSPGFRGGHIRGRGQRSGSGAYVY